MFKYGGPIKEGVMHGMKNGGSMGNNQGPRRAALVGNPIYPQTGGREHHVLPYMIGQGIYAAGRALARPFGSWVAKQIAKKGVTSPGAGLIRSGLGRSRVMQPGESLTQSVNKFNPNWLGKQFIKDPLYKTVAGGTSMFGRGLKWTGQKAAGAGKYAFGTPSGLLFMGAPVTYAAGKYFLSDGKEIKGGDINKIKQTGVPGGGETALGSGEAYYEKPPETISPEELAADAKADRKARLEKYLDTMGYDKAKKGAIGDALIDASAIVQQGTEEGGSLKHADWGKMINQAIQTTSKRLDKPEQIREAIGLMMTKADIEKDMNKDETALARVLTERRIDVLDKQLKGETLEDSINAAFQKTGNFPTGSTLAGIARTKGHEIEGVIDTKTINDFLKKNPQSDSMDFMEINVKTGIEKGKTVNPGTYVVKNRIIAVDSEGNLTQIL
tara:strand:+ start:274 stop:1596 length:1323 start_codon:yes stop_codon:yes gene_type:complete